MLTFAHQKTTGQILGVLTRTSQADGKGDPLVLFAPGVGVSKLDGAHMVTIPATDLDLTAIDPASFPALVYQFRDYQIKDGAPVAQSAAAAATLNATTLNFANAAADVNVYGRIEGDNLPTPITHAAKATVANYTLAMPTLPPGDYRFVAFVQGMKPTIATKHI